MSLGGILYIGRSALLAQRRAMDLTSQNIANALTEGYSRRRLVSNSSSGGLLGIELGGQSLARMRDSFLDMTYRRETSFLGSADARYALLTQISGQINEPSDTGVAAALDGLFTSFSNLANDPSGAIGRQEVRESAQTLIDRLQRLDSALNERATQASDLMSRQVADVNDIAQQLAELNGRIGAAGGSAALLDLCDQRDLLLDHLSQLLAVSVTEETNGAVTVRAGDATLVMDVTAQTLEISSGERGLTLMTANGVPVDPLDGSLKALSELSAEILPDLGRQLDRLAAALVTEINRLHRAGTTSSGETGVDFFNAAGLTAGTITLSDAVDESAESICAGYTPEAGDNTLALELAALGGSDLEALDNSTFRRFYSALVATVGRHTQSAETDSTAASILVDRAESDRSAVSGVITDEEMVLLLAQQQAYAAAAQLVSIADSMIQELLDII